jgi:non-heme chloroperoxidase
MVADLKCLIEQLGGRRPVLVGASMGGGTSLVAIGEDHVDATALVLVDIAPRIETEGVAKIQAS